MELLFEVFGEFLLQVVVEALLQGGMHTLAAPFQKQSSPWRAGTAYLVFGAVVGGISVGAAHYVRGPALGAWRARRGQAVLRIDKFAYGYLFALAFGLMRFWLAQ
ncbi:MAG: hypothetical protein IPF38_10030 [Burkholderiales bacterium]|nr:hypothetical protein [Burkholderiales bacterium]